MVSRNARLYVLFQFLIGWQFYGAVLIIYFAEVTGSYALGMSVLSITMVTAAVFEIPTGIFADLVGRRNAIAIGGVANVLAVVGYAIGGSYWVLVVGAMFEGCARAFWSGNNTALLYESLAETGDEGRFAEFEGKSHAADQASAAIGSLLGGVIAMTSFALVMWLTVIPQALALLTTLWIREPAIRRTVKPHPYQHLLTSLREFRQNGQLRLITVASAIRFAFGESSWLLKPAFINALWPLWAVGLAHTVSTLGASLSFYFSGRLIGRWGALRVRIGENVLNRVVSVVALGYPTLVSPALLASTSFTFGAGQVAGEVLMQREFTDEQRATLGSIGSLLSSLAFAVVSVGMGVLADQIGPSQTLLLAQLVLTVPLVIYWRMFVRLRSAG